MNPSRQNVGLLAMALPIWFWAVYFIMASLRPEYQHATKAISELGSLDAPNGWIWNLLGYIVPGAVVSLAGQSLSGPFASTRLGWFATRSLIASGLMMVLSGVFPGDFVQRTSLTMILHTVGSLGCFLFFLMAGFSFPVIWWRYGMPWRAYAWPSMALVLLSIASGLLRDSQTPGIGQRLGFLCFFVWIAGVGCMLWIRNSNDLRGAAQ